LELDVTDPHGLTTYAGLLLRDLLDHFSGDVQKAIGAYNGGPRNPNPQYATGVQMVASYARNVLERVAFLPQAVRGAAIQTVSASGTQSMKTVHSSVPVDRRCSKRRSPVRMTSTASLRSIQRKLDEQP
jgi:hypothetical protein